VKAVAPASPPDYDPDDLIPLSVAGRMLGFEGGDAMRKGYAAENNLTIVSLTRPGAQRQTLRMIRGEVIAHRQKMIDNARQYSKRLRFEIIQGGNAR
jgi:hypothetical protein